MRPLAPLLSDQTYDETIPLVTVEFTTPDVAGEEHVYMVGKYVNCQVVAWQLAFDPQATITTRSSVDFTYETVTFTAPPTPKLPPTRPVAKEAPLLRRGTFVRRAEAPAAVVAALVDRIDDAYLRMPPVPGESVDHAGQIRLTAFTMTVVMLRDSATGLATGHLVPKPITMSKASGAASIALQNMFAQGTTAPTATITFNKHRPGTTDLTLETLVLGDAKLSAYALQVSGAASTASMALVYRTATLTDNRTSTAAKLDWGLP